MRVLAVTGSSGGHIFPAVSFLDAFKQKKSGAETLLVMPHSSTSNQIGVIGHRIRYIPLVRFSPRISLNNLIALLKYVKGSLDSLWILIRFHPEIVVGFGTIYSLPTVLFAWLLRIKTMIHEQNVVPGRANSFLARFVDKIAISFHNSSSFFKLSKNKFVFTGNPLRQNLKAVERCRALDFFDFDADKFTVLVIGGSQGSRIINRVFLEALALLTDKYSLQIIHITGNKDYDLITGEYKNLEIKFKSIVFLKEIEYAYSISDLVVSRAGASTITELVKFSIPALIIPYPFAYSHQLKNAQILQDLGAAVVIDENKLNPQMFRELLEGLISNPQRCDSMRSAYRKIKMFDAGNLLVDQALSLLKA
ncbi:MAG: UDP-N-acetylglucosamine--N-acetylmuramyl-(pentapeptide) pyrophosphoryl-undecaprenol N-acetylglucosamine transferase [Candidatus Omnitrophica bacterium]|nr:UDP-N-acetylglucosamine--N-acetylmuramyl-(pentapeptide) pyrophosphoryl-undecaprenol N-acetylglucosamine transferase [Candidatus Omnitrophota bacterium]